MLGGALVTLCLDVETGNIAVIVTDGLETRWKGWIDVWMDCCYCLEMNRKGR
jgi:hypothetical protein